MSPFAGDGVAEGVPEVFRAHLADSALGDGTGGPFVTACLWREAGDDRWRHGRIDFPAGLGDPDGTSRLFGLLVDGTAGAFRRFAEGYYERPVDLAAVRHVFALRPLTQDVVTALDAEVSLTDLAEEITRTGYPRASNW